ncbi:MAG TPA: thioredoxin domain-containing protein [Pseudobacter sp.]|jgi:cytochrome oxidase Cu insertion factor (SCO1/SenC/PrrC family)|nr:thioredoxin domain-containing protein [Pseudobacter sp.]
MKKWVLFLSTVLMVHLAMAQTPSNEPPYKRFPTVPPLQLEMMDSSSFTKANVKKQPLIIMFFSPTCDHCQHQIQEMTESMDKFGNTQIILATYQPADEVKKFYDQYQLAKYPNIKIGRDTKYLLPPFYNIRSLPYLALYNKKGDLITTYEGNVKVSKLLQALK